MPGGRWYVCFVLFFGPQRSQSLFFLILTLQRFFPNFHVEACIFLKILLKAFKAINASCTVASKHGRQKNRNSLKLLLTFRSGLVMETGSRNQIGCHKPGDTMLTNIGKYYISLQAESLLEMRNLNQNDGNLTCIANVKSRLIQSTHEKKKSLEIWRNVARGAYECPTERMSSIFWLEKHLCKPLRRHGL